MEGESNFRPWDDLIPDVLVLIFKNLLLQGLLEVIPRVCKPWCKVVYCWQTFDIDEWRSYADQRFGYSPTKENRMLLMLFSMNSGSLRELSISDLDDDQLLFITKHVRSLHTLTIRSGSISDSLLEQVAPKLSSLTTVELRQCRRITPRALESIGRNCQWLVSLYWGNDGYCYLCTPSAELSLAEDARAIAQTMHKLKHLKISSFYFNITIREALHILSGCPELETFDIRYCSSLTLDDQKFLEVKYPKVKVLKNC